MLALEHPDRIHVAFDDHRLVANAGLLLPATLALRLGFGELADKHVDLGDAPGRANPGDKLMTLVASALARRLHRRRRCVARRRNGRCSRLYGEGAIHTGHLPAQLPVGPRPPVGPGEPRVAGPCLGSWGGTRRRTIHHRPGLHHLRDLRVGQGGRSPPRLYRQRGLLAVAAGTGDVLMPVCARAGPTPLGAPPTFYGRHWGGCATPELGVNSQ